MCDIEEIFKEFFDLKDELLEKRGMVTVNQVLEEYLKRYPGRDAETVSCIINNTMF